jgi:ATP-dependent Clp protease ATP-binding subunit ClpA
MDVLDNLGASPVRMRSSVDRMVEDGQPTALSRLPDLPYSARARVVLDQAISVAHEWGDGYVGTQHLMLGLIRERHGFAAQALAVEGLTEASLSREIVRLLQGEGVAAALDADAPARPEELQVPLSIAVELRFEDGSLAKKIFTSKDEAIGFLREKERE